MISFWERNSFIDYDVILIGSGITGLSCAASLKEKAPELDILVLERGIFPSGASTKNAGFACFGSLTELVSDLNTISADQMLSLVKLRWDGLSKLRSRLSDHKIGFLNHGGYELISEKEEPVLEKLDAVNEELKVIFKDEVFQVAPKKIKEFGFNNQFVRQLVVNKFESQIDTGLMMKSLISYCQTLGINIFNGVDVSSTTESDGYVEVHTNQGLTFRTKQLGVTTNAFSKTLFPELDLSPGRGIVVITEPIDSLPFEGTFHYDEGYYYFRNYGKRVIFGGGRNLDFEGEATTQFEINEQIVDKLKELLDKVILPNHSYQIDQTWAGIMGFGETKEPIVKSLSNRTNVGVRMGGMGVAIGSMIGEELANIILDKQ